MEHARHATVILPCGRAACAALLDYGVASMHASRGRRTRRLRFVVTQTILRSREVSEKHTANVSGARLWHFLLRGTVGTDLKRPWLARPEMKMRVSIGIRKTRISEGTDLVEIDRSMRLEVGLRWRILEILRVP